MEMSLVKQVALVGTVVCVSSAVSSFLLSLSLWLHFYLQNPNMSFVLSEQLQFAAAVGTFAIPVGLVLGMAGFFILRHIKFLRWWSVCALGALAGGLVGSTSLTAGVPWLGCVGLGLTSAALAWVLIVRSNLPLNSN
jgi:hypothetical protein